MLKITNCPSVKSFISLHFPLSYGFAPYNKRNFVPKLMKDPKFTRQGIFKPPKKSYQYDLTQPHVLHPERYYNEEVDKKLERKEYRERRKYLKGFEEIKEVRPLNKIIKDLSNEDVLRRGSSRLILNIGELETHYQSKFDAEIHELIIRALRSLNKTLYLKNLREVGIITTMNRKYGLYDKEIWNNLKLNLMKYLRREENDTIQLLSHDINEDNFIHTLNNVLNASKKTGIDVSDILADIETHFLPKIENFKNPHNLVLFTSALTKTPGVKNPQLWAKIEKLITPHVKELNILDAITLINAFSKTGISPAFLDQLVERFVADFGQVADNKVEKISIVALSLANLKSKNEKFNLMAEREIEANLQSVATLVDSQFIISAFARLGIKNKKVFEHCANIVIKNLDTLPLKTIEQFLRVFLPKNLIPKQFFEGLAGRLEKDLEENPLTFEKENTLPIIRGLDKWVKEGILQNDSALNKFRAHSQYAGFEAVVRN